MSFERLGATGDSLRIRNNEWFIARNYAQNGDVKIFRVNTNDEIEFFTIPKYQGSSFALDSQIAALQSQINYILSIINNISAGNINIVPFTLTPAQIAAKSVTLPQTPLPNTAIILPANGIPQLCGVDFSVSGNILSWNSQPFEDVAQAGDNIKILYMF
jgi:hypothetical protein